MRAFTTVNYPRQPAGATFVFEVCRLVFFMEVKSDFIKDIDFARMSESFATVEVLLIERTFFAFSPLMNLLVEGQGGFMFQFELLID